MTTGWATSAPCSPNRPARMRPSCADRKFPAMRRRPECPAAGMARRFRPCGSDCRTWAPPGRQSFANRGEQNHGIRKRKPDQRHAHAARRDARSTTLRTRSAASRTLSKAVSLHLEGKLESAAKLLGKAIEAGEHDPGLYAALGHIHYEMRDYEAAAATYAQLVGTGAAAPHGTFNLGVCQGNLKNWKDAAEAFRRAGEVDATRAEALLGLGISLIHTGARRSRSTPLDKYLQPVLPTTSRRCSARPWPCSRPAGTPKPWKSIARCWRAIRAAKRRSPTWWPCSWKRKTTKRSAAMPRCSPNCSPIPRWPWKPWPTLAFADGDYLPPRASAATLPKVRPTVSKTGSTWAWPITRWAITRRPPKPTSRPPASNPISAQAQLNLGVAQQELQRPGRRARLLRKSAGTSIPSRPACCGTWRWCWSSRTSATGPRSSTRAFPRMLPEWCDAPFRLGYLRLLRGDYAASAAAFRSLPGASAPIGPKRISTPASPCALRQCPRLPSTISRKR